MHITLRKTTRSVLPVLIIMIGLGLAYCIYITKPRAKRDKPSREAPLVEVMKAATGNHQVVISAMGTVIPARKITLKARVRGQVMETASAFEPGGVFREGDVILKLDPQDFELTVRNRISRVNQAQANFELEMGHQDVAREEIKLLQSTSGKEVENSDLALRKPQLVKAEADIETARVNLAQARLDLARTVAKAPFNSIVIYRNVEKGSEISAHGVLATLVGTDEYWIEVAVPVDRLRWIMIPGENSDRGSPARIQIQSGDARSGEVIRLLGELNSKSKMAEVLIKMDDPLALKNSGKGKLLLGSYVSVLIEGKTVNNVLPVPVSVLRDKGTLWLVVDGKLAVRPVQVVWKGMQTAYVGRGLNPGDAIVISELASPVAGMSLRVYDEPEKSKTDKHEQRQ